MQGTRVRARAGKVTKRRLGDGCDAMGWQVWLDNKSVVRCQNLGRFQCHVNPAVDGKDLQSSRVALHDNGDKIMGENEAPYQLGRIRVKEFFF